MPENHRFSAQVLLEWAGQPAQARIERAQRAFAGLGFETGYCVGNSFSITGTAADFHTAFGVALAQRPDGGVGVDGSHNPAGGLPLHKLPDSLRALVSAVLFSEPPAFGPGAP